MHYLSRDCCCSTRRAPSHIYYNSRWPKQLQCSWFDTLFLCGRQGPFQSKSFHTRQKLSVWIFYIDILQMTAFTYIICLFFLFMPHFVALKAFYRIIIVKLILYIIFFLRSWHTLHDLQFLSMEYSSVKIFNIVMVIVKYRLSLN